MKIMISNDDGIFAPGIAALVRAFSQAGHTVVICAPDSQRSAASQALSIHRAMTVEEVPFEGAAQAFAIGGTPADCVKLGLMKLCPDAQAVISGVNHGCNVGTDILYSGTVGGGYRSYLPDYIDGNGKTTYWSRSCRNTAGQGYQHIVGYDGHISMAGHLRVCAIRPACFVDVTCLDNVTGSGTEKDPYVFEIIKK